MVKSALAATLLGLSSWAQAESVVLTTHLPDPQAAYARLLAVEAAFLARDGGFVGIGTTAPQTKLDINGPLRIAEYTVAQETTDPLLINAPNGSFHYDGSGAAPALRVKHNGAWSDVAASAGGGSMRVFDSNGVFIPPAGVTVVTVEAWGGGGRSVDHNIPYPGGLPDAGGGAGAYVKAILNVVPGTPYNVTVGAGGSGGAGNGNPSRFSSLLTAGGGGGSTVEMTGGGSSPKGGVGGTATCAVASCVMLNGGSGSVNRGGSSPQGGGGANCGMNGLIPGGGGGCPMGVGNPVGARGRVIVSW